MNRNMLNAMARSMGFDPATAGFENDSKLEQKILWLMKGTGTAITGTAAASTLTSDNTDVADGDTVTIGPITYRFKTTIAQAYDVKRDGTTADTTLTALVNAINDAGTRGTDYHQNTPKNPYVSAGAVGSHATVITSRDKNINSNLATTVSAPHLSWTGATLLAGTAAVAAVVADAGASTRDTNAGIAGDKNESI